jgi:hypothetical protein
MNAGMPLRRYSKTMAVPVAAQKVGEMTIAVVDSRAALAKIL